MHSFANRHSSFIFRCHHNSSYFFFFFFSLSLFFEIGFFLCVPGYPWTCSVDQAVLELRDLPASVSCVLGLMAFTTAARLKLFLKWIEVVVIWWLRKVPMNLTYIKILKHLTNPTKQLHLNQLWFVKNTLCRNL